MKKSRLLGFVLTLCMCLAIAMPAWAMQTTEMKAQSLEAMNQYIDEAVVGEERAVMQEVLLRVDPEERENVVYIDENDNVYATDPALKAGLTVEYSVDDVLADADAVTDDIMPLDTGKGPYRRISTSNGYSWMSGYVYLPSAGSNLYVANTSNETPYLYIGGTSTSEVDAGMQYNTGNKNWSLFIAVDGSYSFYNTRYQAGQSVFLKYLVTGANKVEVQATGYNVNGTKVTYVKSATANGWNTNGTNCSVKRVTAIAQHSQNLSSGSYMKNITWSNWNIGTSSTNYATWSANATNANVVYPSAIYAQYSMSNHANETVSITL